MKFPALALAATIAAGILFGGVAAAHFPHAISLYLAMSAIGLFAGFLFLACSWTYFAGAASLLGWFCLGIFAAQIQPLAIPSDNVATLASRGSLDLTEPLRWHGALRSDPLGLPWGLRYDVDLQEVRPGDAWRPVTGGMRLEYFFDEKKPGDSVPLRAGDRVEVLTRARVPRNFGDPGAFDERAFLAGQDIYLTATLRDAALLERLDGPPPRCRSGCSGFAATCCGRWTRCLPVRPAARPLRAPCCLATAVFWIASRPIASAKRECFTC